MRVHLLRREIEVPAARDEVFAFFARPENLGEITPPGLGFRILTPEPVPMHAGALIDYVIRLGGLPLRWTTQIAEYEPPERFVDVQLRGPYAFWHHTHTFAESGAGTVIGDAVRYALPLSPLGDLLHPLVRRQLAGIFAYRADVIRRRFGGGGTAP